MIRFNINSIENRMEVVIDEKPEKVFCVLF